MGKEIKIPITEAGAQVFDATNKVLDSQFKHLQTLKIRLEQFEVLNKVLPGGVDNALFDEVKTMLEYNALLYISMLDLAIVAKQLYLVSSEWELLFYAKHGYAIIFETFESYKKVNSKFNKYVKENAASLELEYVQIAKEMKVFRKDFQVDTAFSNIRNQVAAHIDSFDVYYKTITSIKVEESISAITKFLTLLSKLQSFSAKLVGALQAKTAVINKETKVKIEDLGKDIEAKLKKVLSQLEKERNK
ncbi:hypothetical protein [Mucilaginibacter sp. dw_454]|uniref:hypothetical protein n=1 Tax=Mucilaginibacter sp. dw_454 TaxID=2720079 RepID=UPI001BD2D891|nr:hypothetical protein [Mucilaginibacter sp. dw_454]